MSLIIGLHYEIDDWKDRYHKMDIDVELFANIADLKSLYAEREEGISEGRPFSMGILDSYGFGGGKQNQDFLDLTRELVVVKKLPLLIYSYEQNYFPENFPVVGINRRTGGIDIQLPEKISLIRDYADKVLQYSISMESNS